MYYPVLDLFGETQKTAENRMILSYFDIKVRYPEPCLQCIPHVHFQKVGLFSKVFHRLTVNAIVKCEYTI